MMPIDPSLGRVFGPYDQAGLDAQFNLGAAVPDRLGYLARRDTLSLWAYKSYPVRRDLAYGPHPRQRVDVFPSGPGAPLLIFIHGGYWRSSDKESFAFIAPAFVEAGIAVALVEYALCPTVTLPTLCNQVRDAVVWLAQNSRELGIEDGPFVVSGHSAGGHLAVWLSGLDWTESGLTGSPIRGAVSISGLFDLEPIRLSYLNEDLRLDAETARRFSPVHQLPVAAAPVVFCVGGHETEEFRRQQADVVAAWTGAGLTCSVIDMPDQNHFDIIEALGDPGTPLHRATCDIVQNAGLRGRN